MSEHSPEAIKKQVRIYLGVFLALAVLTVVTVGVSYLGLPIGLGILVALIVATVKSSLVAGFFMHLTTEKKLILAILALTVFFFFFVLLVPAWHHY